MLPSLQALADGGEHSIQNVIEHVASRFDLTPEDRNELLPSGRQPVYINRIHWAVTYLGKAGLVSRPRRGVVTITEEGRRVLGMSPSRIDIRFLERYPAFVEFRARRAEPDKSGGHRQGGN
jgi:restriction system protein